ncbi:ADP-ribose pyrophosphatase YjhB (NUDIX family) [Advenella incenata]|jgi:ADP-ribose pyrophosphatase YjhB (NUDIX family)|uniref:ADP-ribose pyrophosphatase YjhB (NUDIX family) n=1 Tax=Advenella incenata TaxID=267800 RepID=A0A4Q7VBG9_9BURK|nr:NUDIX hydrolase [Advenella incenata]RZT92673.1 ADP-ribose pyrophosphatase YjhB (NUDIX family) [Advenella incenata]
MTLPSALHYFPAPTTQAFCSQCGNPLTRLIPPDDNRERDVCNHCGAVHYRNPLIVVGTVPIWNDQILLCRRAIEPRYDTWTLPAGFMELSETTSQGALRETDEEAGADISLGNLFTVLDVPRVNQVHMYFLATVTSERLDPGPESLEARFFNLDEIPWDELSFRTVSHTLKAYLQDRASGVFTTHYHSIE